ncbi:MAG TPA: LacI family DNA-binding transcriptional regulator [Acidimicrobiales bacterium]|nr:LacI family DNA-binding transcriptional regulator [Acidimicrobiales bacterium]
MATINDVADQAGVAASVVSRLLNNDPRLRIRPSTERRILAAVRELDYRPNSAARSLRLAKASTLGLVMHDITNPVYGEIMRGAQQATTEAGYTLLLGDADALARGDEAVRQLLGGRRIDGLLLQRSTYVSDRLIMKHRPEGFPIVLLNDRSTGPLSSVALDDRAGAALAVRHLLELGHTRVAFIGVGTSYRSTERRRAYLSVLREAALPVRDEWIVRGGAETAAGRDAMAALLRTRPRPTAVFVANLNAAVGALRMVDASGLSAPDDISIVAMHDAWFAEQLNPPLTTVRMPLAEMGRAAVVQLLAELGGEPPRHIAVTEPEPVLNARASSAPPQTAGRERRRRRGAPSAKAHVLAR